MIDAVEDGGTVWIDDGDYGPVEVRGRSGVVLIAESGARPKIQGLDFDTGVALFVVESDNIVISGLDITNALAGVYIHGSTNVRFEANRVYSTGQEAIAVQERSTMIDIIGNEIFSTGQREGRSNSGTPFSNFGEGIYLGSAGRLPDGEPDTSSDIRIRNNVIYDVTAEAIDIKPFAANVLVETNVIYDVDTSTSGAVVTGIGTNPTTDLNIVIRGNVIHSVTRTSPYSDGNGIVISGPAEVYANVVYSTQHFGILVDRNTMALEPSSVTVRNNVVRSAGSEAIAQHSEPDNMDIVFVDNSTQPDGISDLADAPEVAEAQAEALRLLDLALAQGE